MNKKWLALVFPLAMMLVAGCGGGDNAKKADLSKQQITVSAAASLQNALNEIKDDFVKDKGLKADQININYAGSGTLRQQIEQGAPSSIFISASEGDMSKLQDKNLMSDVKPFVTNSLVLVVPAGKPQYTFKNLTEVTHLSIGTVETVPAGKYAKETLTYLKLWQPLEAAQKIVFAKDVRAVLAQVAEGAVSAGMVYKTDAKQAGDKVVITDVAPADSHKAIVYPAGIVTKNENDLTKEFYAYLFTEKAQKTLEKYGFTIPATKK